MTYSRPWNAYRQITAQTASPGQLVLMLYDGALQFLRKALTGFDLEDPAEANQTINNNLIRAQDILCELNNTLNVAEGGQLAQTLRRLYEYMDERLIESNLRKNPDGILDTLNRLTVLRDAWNEMLGRNNAVPANPQAGPAPAERAFAASLCACV
jgi:flagellar protein FliS